jgi:hypothetical protein
MDSILTGVGCWRYLNHLVVGTSTLERGHRVMIWPHAWPARQMAGNAANQEWIIRIVGMQMIHGSLVEK